MLVACASSHDLVFACASDPGHCRHSRGVNTAAAVARLTTGSITADGKSKACNRLPSRSRRSGLNSLSDLTGPSDRSMTYVGRSLAGNSDYRLHHRRSSTLDLPNVMRRAVNHAFPGVETGGDPRRTASAGVIANPMFTDLGLGFRTAAPGRRARSVVVQRRPVAADDLGMKSVAAGDRCTGQG